MSDYELRKDMNHLILGSHKEFEKLTSQINTLQNDLSEIRRSINLLIQCQKSPCLVNQCLGVEREKLDLSPTKNRLAWDMLNTKHMELLGKLKGCAMDEKD